MKLFYGEGAHDTQEKVISEMLKTSNELYLVSQLAQFQRIPEDYDSHPLIYNNDYKLEMRKAENLWKR